MQHINLIRNMEENGGEMRSVAKVYKKIIQFLEGRVGYSGHSHVDS